MKVFAQLYDTSGKLPRKADRKTPSGTLTFADGSSVSTPLAWESVHKIADGTRLTFEIADDTQPGGPQHRQVSFTAPFELANREEDYRIAWEFFEKS